MSPRIFQAAFTRPLISPHVGRLAASCLFVAALTFSGCQNGAGLASVFPNRATATIPPPGTQPGRALTLASNTGFVPPTPPDAFVRPSGVAFGSPQLAGLPGGANVGPVTPPLGSLGPTNSLDPAAQNGWQPARRTSPPATTTPGAVDTNSIASTTPRSVHVASIASVQRRRTAGLRLPGDETPVRIIEDSSPPAEKSAVVRLSGIPTTDATVFALPSASAASTPLAAATLNAEVIELGSLPRASLR